MNLERVDQEEIVNVEGERPIRVRIRKEVGQREYNAFVNFEGEENSMLVCWHSVNPEEAKKVAIGLLIHGDQVEKMI